MFPCLSGTDFKTIVFVIYRLGFVIYSSCFRRLRMHHVYFTSHLQLEYLVHLRARRNHFYLFSFVHTLACLWAHRIAASLSSPLSAPPNQNYIGCYSTHTQTHTHGFIFEPWHNLVCVDANTKHPAFHRIPSNMYSGCVQYNQHCKLLTWLGQLFVLMFCKSKPSQPIHYPFSSI